MGGFYLWRLDWSESKQCLHLCGYLRSAFLDLYIYLSAQIILIVFCMVYALQDLAPRDFNFKFQRFKLKPHFSFSHLLSLPLFLHLCPPLGWDNDEECCCCDLEGFRVAQTVAHSLLCAHMKTCTRQTDVWQIALLRLCHMSVIVLLQVDCQFLSNTRLRNTLLLSV